MNYVVGTPQQQARHRIKYKRQEEIPLSQVPVAMCNDRRHGRASMLPEAILLKNGTFMIKSRKPAAVQTPRFRVEHEWEYSDLLLYTPWSSEEQELGAALNDMVVCSMMHGLTDRNPEIGFNGHPMTQIETVKARVITP